MELLWVISLFFFLAFLHFPICNTMKKNCSCNYKNKLLLYWTTYTPPGRHTSTVHTDWVISVGVEISESWSLEWHLRLGNESRTAKELTASFNTIHNRAPEEITSSLCNNISVLLTPIVWFSLALQPLNFLLASFLRILSCVR